MAAPLVKELQPSLGFPLPSSTNTKVPDIGVKSAPKDPESPK